MSKTKNGKIPSEFYRPALKAIREVNQHPGIKKIEYRFTQTKLLRLMAPLIPGVTSKLMAQLLNKPKRKRKPKSAPVVEVAGRE
jgi:hypothetical protein